MRCISLWQPWASLLVRGAKKVETRGRPIQPGPVVIHAALKWDRNLCRLTCDPAGWFVEPFRMLGIKWTRPVGAQFGRPAVPFGALVGIVDVVDCRPTREVIARWSRWEDGAAERYAEEIGLGNYEADRWAWLVANPRFFPTPVPFPGHQYLFDVPPSAIPADAQPAITADSSWWLRWLPDWPAIPQSAEVT